mmetsp:Transcript_21758/g.19273  ORF Transcript_21758/g.19273 Transcript_21758/m.19273 type:complete len:178 (+) Transcript_21758:656-1189(+)
MIDYRSIPKQQKMVAQQGRLPFTRRYTKEKYGEEDSYMSSPSFLYHENQTDKDHDRDMSSRRFKAEIRQSQDGSSYSSKSMKSLKTISEIPSMRSQIVKNQSQPNQLKHISKQKKQLEIIKSSQRISPSKRKISVNTKQLKNLPHPPDGYEYFEEMSGEEEESEEENEHRFFSQNRH